MLSCRDFRNTLLISSWFISQNSLTCCLWFTCIYWIFVRLVLAHSPDDLLYLTGVLWNLKSEHDTGVTPGGLCKRDWTTVCKINSCYLRSLEGRKHSGWFQSEVKDSTRRRRPNKTVSHVPVPRFISGRWTSFKRRQNSFIVLTLYLYLMCHNLKR